MTYPYHYDLPRVADQGDELSIQVRLRRRLKMIAPHLKAVAVPNGGKRTAYAAMKAKQEGMTKGFADLLVLAPGGRVAFLEIKARGGSVRPDQVEQLNWLHHAGFPVGVFRSVDTAIAFLTQHGFIEGVRDAA